VLQPTQEQDGSYEACEGGKCQRRVSIGPVMPVLHKKTYAGEGDSKPDPECGHDIAEADCVPVFHLGNMRLREARSSRFAATIEGSHYLVLTHLRLASDQSFSSAPPRRCEA
jgi:hypothetical protein